MKVARPSPYIWVTWLSKLISGENMCRWASWFKAHYKWDKAPSDFNLMKWTADHNAMLQDRAELIRSDGFEVFLEEQNSFKMFRNQNIIIAGKPDIVAKKEDIIQIYECKTGRQRNSDMAQVGIYIVGLTDSVQQYKGTKPDGQVIYKDGTIIEVPYSEIDFGFYQNLIDNIDIVGGDNQPEKIPSTTECRYCDISKNDCQERME